jgi:pyridoxal 5'-phosphate synthase pdxS subunit
MAVIDGVMTTGTDKRGGGAGVQESTASSDHTRARPCVPRGSVNAPEQGRIPGNTEPSCDNRLARGGPARSNGRGPRGQHGRRTERTTGAKQHMTVETSTWTTKKGLAQMLKGGVIMDVVTPEHAKIAEEAGAVAVMALERVPADIRAAGGVARMSDPQMIESIMNSVTIPVMAKARIGHFVEAQVLEAIGVDYIDESEVLTPADEANHIDKHAFKVPFVCGCRNLGEALRRISEGAAMIRTKGEAGTGNVVEAVRQLRNVLGEIRRLQSMREDELFVAAKELQAPYDLVRQVAAEGRLPVVNFVAGGVSTPADAALVMQLGAEGVFVGSGIFKSEDPARMANAIVQATTHFDNPAIVADVSKGLGAPMRGIALEAIPEQERLAVRGW